MEDENRPLEAGDKFKGKCPDCMGKNKDCEKCKGTGEVEFKGMTRVDASEIEELLADLKGQNILLVSLEAYEDRIKMHPRVERVAMKRVLPDKVTCRVEEREPVALIFTDQFLEVDRHGMVMADDEYSAILDLPISAVVH